MSPDTSQESVPILIAVAKQYGTRRTGDADVAPVELMVVVPLLAAVIVTVYAPTDPDGFQQKFSCVPIG